MTSDIESIDEDEFLYRRIPVSMGWVHDEKLSPEAFGPNPRDDTGISVSRAEFTTIEKAAVGPGKKGYYVASLRAGDLIAAGITVVASPDLGGGKYDSAHAELPQLTYATRKSTQTLEQQRLLAQKLCLEIHGPFVPEPLREDET